MTPAEIAKRVLRRRGSKHARHSRHGVVSVTPFLSLDRYEVHCRCGGLILIFERDNDDGFGMVHESKRIYEAQR